MFQRAVKYGLLSVPLGFVLMVPLSALFDAMNWPLFQSWGLIHGSFLMAWPMLTVLAFCALLCVDWLWRHRNSLRFSLVRQVEEPLSIIDKRPPPE